MSLIWNLSYAAEVSPLKAFASKITCGKVDPSKKFILSGVYGQINVGELVALLGPSGAGKSTLINCLIYGDKFDGYEGDIYTTALEEPIRASMINQNEEEHLLPSLTVAQSLRYASRLKNPPSTPTRVHEAIVQDLIKELSLTSCQNTEVERCSTGEKKRLAIGLELTPFKKPHFLFLDEPTSGLDSYVGYKVIKLLARLAKAHNMAIVTTIHQPSYKLFTQFEKAFILSGRGDIIFNDKPKELKRMLETCGYDFGDDLQENPADAAIELASYMRRQVNEDDDFPLGYYDDSLCLIDGQHDLINPSLINDQIDKNQQISYENVCKTILKNMQEKYAHFALNLQNPSPNTKLVRQESGLSRNETPFSLYIFAVLLMRCAHTSILKQQKFTMIKFMLHFVVAVVLAMLYHRDIGKADSCVPNSDAHNCSCIIRKNDVDEPHKNVTFQFFSLLFLMFASLMPTVLTFPSEIKLFWCEFRNGWYSSSTYYIAKTVVEIPFQLIFPTLYVYFLYWYSHQIGMDFWYEGIIGFMSTRYSHFLGVTILCCFIAQGLGFLIGILCVRSFNISIIVSSSLLLFLFLFSGFFVKRIEISESVSWITDFSFVRFGLESLLIIIFGSSRCDPPLEKFSSVMKAFNLNDDDFRFNVVMLFVHLFMTRFLAFVIFKKKAGSRLLPKFTKLRAKLFRNKNIKQEELSGNIELL